MNAQARWAFHVEHSHRWLRLESLQALIRSVCSCVRICACVSLTVTLIYRCHWLVHLSDEILCSRIWFALPVTATQRVLTDGIYTCSMSKCLELDPLLWSWKAPSKTWNILFRSREIYLWACLKIKKQKNMWPESKCTQHIHTFSFKN